MNSEVILAIVICIMCILFCERQWLKNCIKRKDAKIQKLKENEQTTGKAKEEEVSSLNVNLDIKCTEISNLQARVRDLEAQLLTSQAYSNTNSAILQAEIQKLIKEKAATEKEKEEEVSRLKVKLNYHCIEHSYYQNSVFNLQEQLSSLKSSSNEKEEQISNLEDKVCDLKVQLLVSQDYSKTKTELQQEVRMKYSKFLEMQTKVRTLNSQLLQNGGNDFVLLDELIEQRKEEKQKALQDSLKNQIQIIEDRRAKEENFEMFPEGAFERLKNNSIWEIVLGYLNDQSDLSSASSACQEFTNILDGRRKLLLLPHVLKVFKAMADKTVKYHEVLSKAWAEDLKMICLSARGLCKAWSEVAEFQLFEFNFDNDDWFLRTDLLKASIPTSNAWSLTDQQSVDQASSVFVRPETPFLRNLHVMIRGGSANASFRTKISRFLKMYGKSVWFLQLEYVANTVSLEEYEAFLTMMEFMPNLRGLELEFGEQFRRHERNLLQQFYVHPFPALDSLEHFRYSGSDNFLPLQILQNCVNLKSVVNLRGNSFTPDITQALLALRLERYEGYMSTIITSNQVNWPLKRLFIETEFEAIDDEEIFQGIARFKDTLEQLIFGEHFEIERKHVRLLQFPNLKLLGMDFSGSEYMQIDDLLQLKSLENISAVGIREEDENSQVQVYSYFNEDRMMESKLWECFPYLMQCTLEGRVFFRLSHAGSSNYHRIAYFK